MSNQAKYSSKKWKFFVSHPADLLHRQIRTNVYKRLNLLTDLKVTRLLSIYENSRFYTFLDKHEDAKNKQIIKNDYQSWQAEKYLKQFKKLIQNSKFKDRDSLQKVIKAHLVLGPILVYNVYLDDLLTKKVKQIKKLRAAEQKRLLELIKQNNLRDSLLKYLDSLFKRTLLYLRRKLNIRDLGVYLLEEIKANKKLDPKALAERKIFCVSIWRSGKIKLFTGQKAKAVLKQEAFIINKIKVTPAIKGFPVFGGKVRGRVLIINRLTDFKKTNTRPIVVSPMTAPHFVPYLKKVKGLITDEGGVNCHAAVCAREFRIPCIVGTKIATQVFKDGDLVEVDANQGIVKKLT